MRRFRKGFVLVEGCVAMIVLFAVLFVILSPCYSFMAHLITSWIGPRDDHPIVWRLVMLFTHVVFSAGVMALLLFDMLPSRLGLSFTDLSMFRRNFTARHLLGVRLAFLAVSFGLCWALFSGVLPKMITVKDVIIYAGSWQFAALLLLPVVLPLAFWMGPPNPVREPVGPPPSFLDEHDRALLRYQRSRRRHW